jgi:hypothetical protein
MGVHYSDPPSSKCQVWYPLPIIEDLSLRKSVTCVLEPPLAKTWLRQYYVNYVLEPPRFARSQVMYPIIRTQHPNYVTIGKSCARLAQQASSVFWCIKVIHGPILIFTRGGKTSPRDLPLAGCSADIVEHHCLNGGPCRLFCSPSTPQSTKHMATYSLLTSGSALL